MTGLPDTPAQNPPSELSSEMRAWCEAWKTCFENVISQVSSNVATTFEISLEPPVTTESDAWYTVVAGGAVHGEMTLRLPAAAGSRLARKFLGETEQAGETFPEAMSAENKEALEELLRQIAGLAATALAVTAGGEVQLHLTASAAPTWSSDTIVCLQTRGEAGIPVAIEIRISPALATALLPRPQSAPASPLPPPPSHSPSSEAMPASSYRRLMDVGLDVKLRFGIRRMLLREVLAFSAGVVVELDNTLHSPVDLLLDGRLIAQGEVVVVDGKYGLRVTDVVDPAPEAGLPA
jgi:flagellar motor switch protein FliN